MPKKQQPQGSIPLVSRRVSKVKPMRLKKTQQALSEKNHQPRAEESKELPSPIQRRPRRETESNKARPDDSTTKDEKTSPRKYARKVVSEVK